MLIFSILCVTQTFFLSMVIAAMKLKDTYSLEGVMTNPDSILKSRDTTLPTKVRQVKAIFFPVVWM